MPETSLRSSADAYRRVRTPLQNGTTAAEWRRRGIYRALVAHRATLAAARGFRYLATDASEDSRPILERLGFVPVTSVTPYERMPPPSEA